MLTLKTYQQNALDALAAYCRLCDATRDPNLAFCQSTRQTFASPPAAARQRHATHPAVDFWVRNVERRPESFWLQTYTDKFYPDFVCQMAGGRTLVVEYKSETLWSNDDSREKRALGKLWSDLSAGQCRFVMPKGKDFAAIAVQMQ